MSHSLAAYGWDERVAGLFALCDAAHVPGRVTRVDRGSCLVATAGGVVRASPYHPASRLAGLEGSPVTGDWVTVADAGPGEVGEADWAVTGIVPRWSAVSRKDADDRVTVEQVLVANIDFVALVSALDRPLAPNLVERLLAAAWESGATPVVVLTKADVAADLEGVRGRTGAVAAGVAIHATSTRSGQGIEEVRALIQPARTLALIGPSGAGKSSLVNALAGRAVQSTGAVRADDHRGRHTTTSRDLIALPGGGVVVDTPGLRGLGLWDASAGVAATFDDIDALALGCRFGDCAHRSEPGCAVRAAIRSGAVERRRLLSYHKLQDELADLQRHQDQRGRRRPAGSARRT